MSGGTFNALKFSKEQAQVFLAQTVTQKQFWHIHRENDHLMQLQSVLDVLYNSGLENRVYVAHYQCLQSKKRMIIRCLVCIKLLGGYVSFIDHNKGKCHKMALMQRHPQDNINLSAQGMLIYRDPSEPNGCFQKGSLEDMLDKTQHPVLGYQFVYMEMSGSEDFFTCQLCSSSVNPTFSLMTKEDTFSHIISEAHQMQYMVAMYDRKDLKQKPYSHAFQAISKIVELEGRIQSKIARLHYSEPLRTESSVSDKIVTDNECQATDDPQTPLSFVEELNHLQKQMCEPNENDGLKYYLKEDREAFDLMVAVVKIFSQKFVDYGENVDKAILDPAKRFEERATQIKVPYS